MGKIVWEGISVWGVPSFKQGDGLCGPASLKVIMDYYGTPLTEGQIAQMSAASSEIGTWTEGLMLVARKYGYTAKLSDNTTEEQLRNELEKGPVIVDWNSGTEGHFSVVVGITDYNIVLMDPEYGHNRLMTLDYFLQNWYDWEDRHELKEMYLPQRMLVVRPWRTWRIW